LTESNAAQSTGGTLTVTDVDSPTTFIAQTNVAGTNGYGKFTVNAAGVWTYVMNNAHDEFVAGTVYIDKLTVTTTDGVTQALTVNITGTNDLSVITGTSTVALTENNAAQSTGGTLTVTDVDSPTTFIAQTNVAGTNGYGKFTVNAAGVWTYVMNNAHDEFVAGTVYTDKLMVTTTDGVTQALTVNITGTNDAPTASAVTHNLTDTAAIESGTVVSSGNLISESGASDAEGQTLTITGIKGSGDASALIVSSSATAHGTYGDVVVQSNGTYAYTAKAAFDALNTGDAPHDTFTFTVSDGNGGSVQTTLEFDITGSTTAVAAAPYIHTPVGGISYWASSTGGDVSPINRISFEDADAGNTAVRVTFSMNDNGDELTASNLTGSGVSVVGGNGAESIILQGTIAAINAYLHGGNLTWNPDGSTNHEAGSLTITIDDNGAAAGGNFATTTISIQEIADPSFSNSSANDFSGVNFTSITGLDAGNSTDTITTSWSHQPSSSATIYDGGSGNDTINLVFTAEQLHDIFANSTYRAELGEFLHDPGDDLNLNSSSWSASAVNFETAHIYLAEGYGNGTTLIDAVVHTNNSGDFTNLNIDSSFNFLGGNTLNGSSQDDILVDASFFGGDTLKGGAGNDLLMGGSGSNNLAGGTGNDVLAGGEGATTFKFSEAATSSNLDTIVNYSFSKGDEIDLSGLLDSISGVQANGANISSYVRVIQSGADLSVQVDTTGNANFAGHDVATLAGYGTSAADIVNVVFKNVDHTLTA
jgi:VCBS repeat-containing protein